MARLGDRSIHNLMEMGFDPPGSAEDGYGIRYDHSAGFYALQHLPVTSRIALRRTATFTLTTSPQDLQWDTETHKDADFTFSATSALITVNYTGIAYVEVGFSCEYVSGTSGQVTFGQIQLQNNAAAVGSADAFVVIPHISSGQNTASILMPVSVTAADVLKCRVLESGGTGTIRTQTTGNYMNVYNITP